MVKTGFLFSIAAGMLILGLAILDGKPRHKAVTSSSIPVKEDNLILVKFKR